MKQKFDEEFPEEDLVEIPEALDPEEKQIEKTFYENTIELSSQGFTQTMVLQLIKNEIKIRKTKIKLLKKEKKEIKEYLKENLLTKGTKEAK